MAVNHDHIPNPDPDTLCLLCGAESSFFYSLRQIEYYRCNSCLSVFMLPAYHPEPDTEKARYEAHNNDVYDTGYREFVRPLVEEVTENFDKGSEGLDYGAGTDPVAATMLCERGYRLELYDPFFRNNRQKLKRTYDYIICSEVMEHFHRPGAEFRLLRSLLNTGGSLICMTELFTDDIDFGRWRYKDDITHVFFYHPGALEWIKSNYLFISLKIKGKIITFST